VGPPGCSYRFEAPGGSLRAPQRDPGTTRRPNGSTLPRSGFSDPFSAVERLIGPLVGTQWLLVVEHNESNGKVYANITNAMKAPESQQVAIWEQREAAF